jgi:hypothetical protein
MGGFRSGGWHGAKSTTDERCSLDVRQLQRDGSLMLNGRTDITLSRSDRTLAVIALDAQTDRLMVSHVHGTLDYSLVQMSYSVMLTTTPCTYGGHRAWFLCPSLTCGRRVAKMYFGVAEILACRHCYQLAYACQREAADVRMMRRADAVRARLGWGAGILNGHGGKPRGMHPATYERLVSRHDVFVEMVVEGQARWTDRLQAKLNKMLIDTGP